MVLHQMKPKLSSATEIMYTKAIVFWVYYEKTKPTRKDSKVGKS